eukprot:3978227-Prymnesium_polylepis.1
MLTALVNLTMAVDGIEATRLGTSPWYHLAIDALGFVAVVVASSDYVRQVTREKEYQEGLARENARSAKMAAQFVAEAQLKAAIERPLLRIHAAEVEAARSGGAERAAQGEDTRGALERRAGCRGAAGAPGGGGGEARTDGGGARPAGQAERARAAR